MPPSIVLECLRILEAEVNLREDTRITEQAKAAVSTEDFEKSATQLGEAQAENVKRLRDVVERIRELPDAEANFAKEIGLLEKVATVMEEAQSILNSMDTGPAAVAAETEAIELLLQSKRINPKGGGGGGASPGGGGGGDTSDSAIALLGKSSKTKEVREETGKGRRQEPSVRNYRPNGEKVLTSTLVGLREANCDSTENSPQNVNWLWRPELGRHIRAAGLNVGRHDTGLHVHMFASDFNRC